MRILSIETSCDETGISIIEASGGSDADFTFAVLGNALLSQAALHAPHGGVFPNLARREHEMNLVPLLTQALHDAGMLKKGTTETSRLAEILARETELLPQLMSFLAKYTKPDIDCIAVTHGPGLEPALWVGVNFAKALAYAWKLPIVPVNHMEGHVIISMIRNDEGSRGEVLGAREFNPKTKHLEPITFPVLSLLISGGHTELVLSKEWMQYELVGQTRDDAVGEAFDKVARLLDLPYPGGPEIDRLAKKARDVGLTKSHIVLPRPMMDTPDYDFSFSGLKTAVRRAVESNQPLDDDMKMEIAREFEDACADVLVAKTMKAIEEFGVETLLIGGGVSANEQIHSRLAAAIKDYGYDTKLLIPPHELSTDNALMIALAGYFRALKKEFADADALRANGNLKLSSS
ncbi:MAG: tRNA (adenosine(37)-N6)-threonylcarbamoyltransferase complex transferase subunit TsaD [Minisyncoccia bacterium]